MAAAVAWWRACVQCGHEGHAQSPRVCVLEWGWPLCLLPQVGMEQRSKGGTGRDFPLLAPPPEKWCSGGDGRGVTAQGVAGSRGLQGSLRYSITRQRGRCCEKYLKSSGVAPGQLVSSSSSSSCSCTRPDRPVVVRRGHPARARQRNSCSASQLHRAGGQDRRGRWPAGGGSYNRFHEVGPVLGLEG